MEPPESPPPAPPSPGEVQTDAAGRIAEQVHCRDCGYSIFGLPINGDCPECGTSIAWSVRGNLLAYSDPAWLAKLAASMGWLIAWAFASIASGFVAGAVGAATSSTVPESVLNAIVSALLLIGLWLFSAPEPNVHEGPGINARKLIRLGIAVNAVVSVFGLLAGTLGSQTINPSWLVPITIGGMMVAIISVASFIAAFVHGQRLALRIPDPSLASQTRIVMWGLISLYVLMFAIGGFALLGVMNAPAPPGALFGTGVVVVVCIFALAALALFIWTIVLLFRYRGAFLNAARQARDSLSG